MLLHWVSELRAFVEAVLWSPTSFPDLASPKQQPHICSCYPITSTSQGQALSGR